jgi:hypothetical protein
VIAATTAAVCIVASLLLGWRLASSWDHSSTLVRLLTGLLGASVFLASVLAALVGPVDSTVATVVLLLVLGHGFGCIGVAAAWPQLQYRFTIPHHRGLASR